MKTENVALFSSISINLTNSPCMIFSMKLGSLLVAWLKPKLSLFTIQVFKFSILLRFERLPFKLKERVSEDPKQSGQNHIYSYLVSLFKRYNLFSPFCCKSFFYKGFSVLWYNKILSTNISQTYFHSHNYYR